MMTTPIRFYLDENVPIEVARQLERRGIEATTARDLVLLGASDGTHLKRATGEGYVLCTYDSDFLEIAAAGTSHSGIVFGQQDIHYIGDWVRFLSLLHAVYTSEEMRNRIEFL